MSDQGISNTRPDKTRAKITTAVILVVWVVSVFVFTIYKLSGGSR